jgi:hypothetical protein
MITHLHRENAEYVTLYKRDIQLYLPTHPLRNSIIEKLSFMKNFGLGCSESKYCRQD